MNSKSSPSRRDFLKLTSLVPLGVALPPFVSMFNRTQATPEGRKNVLVIVFDAWSAHNISLYGYARETTPNIARLAERAIVYHNHFAGSNYTTSGTASLLTSTLPWTHRALEPDTGVSEHFVTRNIFTVFADYYRLAYTPNVWAFTLLRQLQGYMDELVPREKLSLRSYDSLVANIFGHDEDIADVSWARDLRITDAGYAYSLLLSHAYAFLGENQIPENLKRLFPRGLPTTGFDRGFLLEEAVDWLKAHIATGIARPFFGYLHFFPPHAPYNTPVQFYNRFQNDGYEPPHKPVDVFAVGRVPYLIRGDPEYDPRLLLPRRQYDEYILYADQEFGRFYDGLEASGVLDDTWVVLTSDHGEMFERGLVGHGNPTLYQPVIRVPLMIFEPGRQAGMEIHAQTSVVDLLPTLAHITGHTIPEWTEGVVLPPYAGGGTSSDRSIYSVSARENHNTAPLRRAATMLVKGRYKLHYYFGYYNPRVDELVKLYDIEADPEELEDLSSSQPDTVRDLLAELKSKIAVADQPYL